MIGSSPEEKADHCPNPAVTDEYKESIKCTIYYLFGAPATDKPYTSMMNEYNDKAVSEFKTAIKTKAPWLFAYQVYPEGEEVGFGEKLIGLEEDVPELMK